MTLSKADVGLDNVPNVDASNAGNIAAGTLADARLSSNVPLKNAANTWSAPQSMSVGASTTTSSAINSLGAAGTGNITVASTAGWPDSGFLAVDFLTSSVEVMAFAKVNATTLNVTARAQFGTGGAAHANGATLAFIVAWIGPSTSSFPHMVRLSNGKVACNSLNWTGSGVILALGGELSIEGAFRIFGTEVLWSAANITYVGQDSHKVSIGRSGDTTFKREGAGKSRVKARSGR